MIERANLYRIHNGESYEDAQTYVLEHNDSFTDEQLGELLVEATKRALVKEVRRDTRQLRKEGTSRQEFMVEYDLGDYIVSVVEEDILHELTTHFGFRWPEYAASNTMSDHCRVFEREE